MSKKVTDTVQEMAQPIVDSLQLELVDIEFVKEGQSWFLRVFIDSDDGVDIEECAKVSEALSEKLALNRLVPHFPAEADSISLAVYLLSDQLCLQRFSTLSFLSE